MKKKLKKYTGGANYIQPEYNVQSQQRTGKGMAGANALINGGTALAGVAGGAIQNSALQANYNNPEQGVSTGKYTAGGALKGASVGAQYGSALGPIGIAVGGAIGAGVGALNAASNAKSINATAANTKRINQQLKKQAGYSAQEIDQVGYAKKGLDMTKKKLKKYPGGTASVATQNLPRFTAAENETLRPLQGTDAYKQAIHTAIDYKPKYINPRPGSTQAAYEDSTYNAKLATFNTRDQTKSPANFGNAIPAFDANRQQNNLNYNAQNTKLDSFVANGGAQLPNNLSIPNTPGQMPNAMKKTIYKNGTKGISKYPNGTGKLASEGNIELTTAERSALPAAGTQEHRQAIWDLLGYKPSPYPAGSQGYANQEKHFNSAVELINQGYRPAVSPSGNKGYEKLYKSGSKKIEVEGDEIQLAKKGNKFVVKQDFKDMASHEEGGVVIEAQEGDIITPANRRKEVVEALKEGDHKEIEKIRKSLPKDKPSYKMKDGTKKVNTTAALDKYKYSGIDAQAPLSGNPVTSTGYTPMSLRPIKGVKTSGSGIVNNTLNVNTDNIGNAAGLIGEIAPIAYNIGTGLGKTVQTNRRNFNPTQYTYQDNSQPLRNQANSLYNQDKQLIRNVSGGNAGTYLANVGLASTRKFKNLQEINNREAGRKVDVQNANTELQNNSQLTNLQLNNQYDQQDLQNEGTKQGILATGLGQLSTLAQKKTLEKNTKNVDQQTLKLLRTGNYKLDENGEPILIKRKGSSGIKTKYKMKK